MCDNYRLVRRYTDEEFPLLLPVSVCFWNGCRMKPTVSDTVRRARPHPSTSLHRLKHHPDSLNEDFHAQPTMVSSPCFRKHIFNCWWYFLFGIVLLPLRFPASSDCIPSGFFLLLPCCSNPPVMTSVLILNSFHSCTTKMSWFRYSFDCSLQLDTKDTHELIFHFPFVW